MTEPRASGPRLRSWRLTNFKSVRQADIEFKPLTLLVGANSSGKSSVLQSILLAVQSVQSGASNGQFSLNGPLVDLGTYADVRNMRSNGRAGFGGTLELPPSAASSEAVGAKDWPSVKALRSAAAPALSQRAQGHSFSLAPESPASTTIDWDVAIELAGAKASGSARVHGVEVDLTAGSKGAVSRYHLSLTKASQEQVPAMFWPTGRLAFSERDVVVASMPAFNGTARRKKPRPQGERIGAAAFAGVMPVSLAAGQPAVRSAVDHWIGYLRGAVRSSPSVGRSPGMTKAKYLSHYSLGRVSPEQIAVAPWPAPAMSSPADVVVRSLIESLRQQRLTTHHDFTWPWCLLENLELLRYADQLPPERLASLAADEPVAKLLFAVGLVNWVRDEEIEAETYRQEMFPEGAEKLATWTSDDKTPEQEKWYAAGVALEQALVQQGERISEAVAEAFPDAGDTCVEPGEEARVLADASSSAASFLQNDVYYLGPLREEPHAINRRSLVPGSSALGTSGEYTAAVLVEHADRRIDAPCPPESGRDREIMSLRDAVKEWVRHFGIADDISVEESSLGPLLQVREKPTSKWLHLTHVGVGVSQLLPVIVLCLLADEGSVVMLEQPELHLHPKLQQQLGDFLLACARAGRQLIVETHSEYIVSRLRFRIADAPDDSLLSTVGIVFAEKNFKGDTRFRPVRANAFGGIEEWPKDFFDQSTNEAQEILKAAIRKRRAAAPTQDSDQGR